MERNAGPRSGSKIPAVAALHPGYAAPFAQPHITPRATRGWARLSDWRPAFHCHPSGRAVSSTWKCRLRGRARPVEGTRATASEWRPLSIMKTLDSLRLPVTATCAALGSVGLLASFVVLGGHVPAGAGPASASAAPASPPQIDPDSAFCHGSSSAGGWMNARIQLAASRTEVPPAEMQ